MNYIQRQQRDVIEPKMIVVEAHFAMTKASMVLDIQDMSYAARKMLRNALANKGYDVQFAEEQDLYVITKLPDFKHSCVIIQVDFVNKKVIKRTYVGVGK